MGNYLLIDMSEGKRMKITSLTCPHCGAALQWEEGQDKAKCPYCGSALRVDISAPEIKVNFYGGREPAKPAAAPDIGLSLGQKLIVGSIVSACILVPVLLGIAASSASARRQGAADTETATASAYRQLESYTLSGVENLDELQTITGLKYLTIEHAEAISDFSALARLPYLETLTIQDAPQLTDLSFVKSLNLLQSLDLQNTGAEDLSPLAGMKSLVTVKLSGNKATDYSPLASVPYLKTLEIQAEEISALPDLSGAQFIETYTVNGETKE